MIRERVRAGKRYDVVEIHEPLATPYCLARRVGSPLAARRRSLARPRRKRASATAGLSPAQRAARIVQTALFVSERRAAGHV